MIHRKAKYSGVCLAALSLALVAVAPGWAADTTLKARGGAKTSINRGAASAKPASRPAAGTRPARPAPARPGGGGVNIQQDNDINVNIQSNHHGGVAYPPAYHDYDHDYHDHHDDWDDWNDWDDHPFATAAAVTAGVAVTNAIIGSIVYSVPAECVPVDVNGATYQRCGNTWYKPQYAGTSVQYVVVAAPI